MRVETTSCPTQINNVLAFPGLFRGMLDAGSHEITNEVMLAAAGATADSVARKLNLSLIVPSVFDTQVAPSVAAAVRDAAQSSRSAAQK